MTLKDLNSNWIEDLSQPLMIAGPCSAESEAQMLETARRIRENNINVPIFRAGIWKPRTKPNGFEGVGVIGLNWLKKVKEEYGFKTATEVANAHHVAAALEADVDILWIGARSTVNPFTVQEIAEALRGTEKTVLVKNPVIIRKSLRRKKNQLRRFKRKKNLKNLISGAEIKIMILLKKMMKMKNQAECFHLLLPKPFQKNTLKIFCGNLKWVFWKGMWLWK